MSVTINCPKCNVRLGTLKPEYIGKRVKCARCGHVRVLLKSDDDVVQQSPMPVKPCETTDYNSYRLAAIKIAKATAETLRCAIENGSMDSRHMLLQVVHMLEDCRPPSSLHDDDVVHPTNRE